MDVRRPFARGASTRVHRPDGIGAVQLPQVALFPIYCSLQASPAARRFYDRGARASCGARVLYRLTEGGPVGLGRPAGARLRANFRTQTHVLRVFTEPGRAREARGQTCEHNRASEDVTICCRGQAQWARTLQAKQQSLAFRQAPLALGRP